MRRGEKVEQVAERKERRQYERLEKEFTFHFTILDDLANDELDKSGLILDIGGGGLRFLSSERMNKNDQLLMKLDFAGWRIDGATCVAVENSQESGSMLVIGTVMWSTDTIYDDQFEVGVRFTARMQKDKKE